MSLRVQAAHGVKWQAVEVIGRQLLSFVVVTTLARLLQPSAFGLLGLVGVYITFVGMFVDQGISAALIQRKDLTTDHLNAAFWFNLICASAFCLVTIASAPWIADFFNEPSLSPLLRWSSSALILNSLAAVQGTLFIRELNFRQHALRGLLSYIIGGGIGVAMALGGHGVWALVGQLISTALTGSLFMYFSSAWRPEFRFSIKSLRELMAVGSSVFIDSFLFFITSRLDQMAVGRYLGAETLGQYTFATKLPEMAKSIVHNPLQSVSVPMLSRLQSDHPRMARALYEGMELNTFVSFAAFVGLAAIAPTITPLLFGEQWIPAVPYIQLWAMHALVIGLFVYCMPTILATGGLRQYVIFSVFGSLGTVIVCFFGVKLGACALLVGLIVNIFGLGVSSLFFLRRKMGVSPALYLQPVLVPLLASAAMFTSVHFTRLAQSSSKPGWLALSIQICTGAVVYLIVVLVLDRKRFLAIGRIISIFYHRRPPETKI